MTKEELLNEKFMIMMADHLDDWDYKRMHEINEEIKKMESENNEARI